jgi:hypothetical protein
MKSPAAVRKEATIYILDRLESRGFFRNGIFLLRGRAAGIHDCISFPSVVHEKNGPIALSANIGLYVEPLHRSLGEDVGATFCTNIGYVSPQGSWTEWLFDRDSFSGYEAQQLLASLVTHGLPFMESFVNYDDVISGCERFGFAHLNTVRLPILRALAASKE